MVSEIDCFEPIFGFLMQFWFKKHRSDTWDPKVMFSAPSGRSGYWYNLNFELKSWRGSYLMDTWKKLDNS